MLAGVIVRTGYLRELRVCDFKDVALACVYLS